jgi:hypothetical protein
MNFEISALPKRVQEKIYVEPNTGCWIWLGTLSVPGNYGFVRVENRNIYVHRFCYEWFHGLIGSWPEKQLDHLCRTRCCCNPAHLEIVTPKVNINRGRRFNAEKTYCKRGHPFDEQNTYVTPSTGARHCRICAREYMAEYFKQHKK